MGRAVYNGFMVKALVIAVAALLGVTSLILLLGAHHEYVQPEILLASAPPSSCSSPTIPLTTSVVDGQAQESVNVCIKGHPYPFIIDTGAVQSSVNTELAADLGLATVGPKQTFAGLGCLGSYRQVEMSGWSLSGVPLDPAVVSAQTPLGMGKAVGLLGADVLSRFGSVRLDFAAKRLVLGAPAAAGTTITGHVTRGANNVAMTVPVRVAGRTRTFLVDTGASQSAVDSSVALPSAGVSEIQDTDCSQTTVPVVNTGRWSLAGARLASEQVGSTAFGALRSAGITGLLGDDELVRHPWVIINFRTSQLTLGVS